MADGFPVNFYDTESVPKEQIQFIITMLFYSLIFLIELGSTAKSGIVPFPDTKAMEIINYWRRFTTL